MRRNAATAKARQTLRFASRSVLTGDPVLDAVIERFVSGEGEFRCDTRCGLVDFWRWGGVDGRAYVPPPPISRPDRRLTAVPDPGTWTRTEIMEARQ